MRKRRSVVAFAVLTLLASALLVVPAAGADEHMIECDDEYVKVSDNRIMVWPTGVDDTENLQCALDLAASMPWAKIKLMEGDYYTSFLEVEGFNGVIRGEGRTETTIYTLPDGLDCVARVAEVEDFPALMLFVASKVTLNGFTVALGGDTACAEPWEVDIDEEGFGAENWGIDAVRVADRLRVGDACAGDVDHRLRVFDVGFESDFPDFSQPIVLFTGFEAAIAAVRAGEVLACPDTWLEGPVVVRHSHFAGTVFTLVVATTEDSRALIGGSKPWQANTFDDVGIGVLHFGNNGSKALIKGNAIHDAHFWGVLGLADEMSGDEPTKITVAKNRIRGIDTADGVGVVDFGLATHEKPLLDSRVWWNHIEMVDTEFNGIIAIGTDGKIIGNRISGSSFSGIMLDGVFDPEAEEILAESTGWYVAKNKLRQYEGFGADIWLWPSTRENTVMCRCEGDEVVDLGVDNVITGCTIIEPPPVEPGEALLDEARLSPQRHVKALPELKRWLQR